MTAALFRFVGGKVDVGDFNGESGTRHPGTPSDLFQFSVEPAPFLPRTNLGYCM